MKINSYGSKQIDNDLLLFFALEPKPEQPTLNQFVQDINNGIQAFSKLYTSGEEYNVTVQAKSDLGISEYIFLQANNTDYGKKLILDFIDSNHFHTILQAREIANDNVAQFIHESKQQLHQRTNEEKNQPNDHIVIRKFRDSPKILPLRNIHVEIAQNNLSDEKSKGLTEREAEHNGRRGSAPCVKIADSSTPKP
jgi:hypothetical protein